MIRKIVAWYMAIGVAVACFAWSIDTSEGKAEAWSVFLVFAAFWPLWLLLYATFG